MTRTPNHRPARIVSTLLYLVWGLGTSLLAACSSGDTCSNCGPSSGGSGQSGGSSAGGSAHGGVGGSGASGGSGGTGFSENVVSYCDCMLNDCHDDYHRVWGEDHISAEESCRAEAASYAENGAPTDSGDFIECRLAACGRGAEDPSACAAALGSGACAPTQ